MLSEIVANRDALAASPATLAFMEDEMVIMRLSASKTIMLPTYGLGLNVLLTDKMRFIFL